MEVYWEGQNEENNNEDMMGAYAKIKSRNRLF